MASDMRGVLNLLTGFDRGNDMAGFSSVRATTGSDTLGILRTYRELVLSEGPIGHWSLDETTGTTFLDSSPRKNSMSSTGSPSLGVEPLVSDGHAISFTSSSQYLTSGVNLLGGQASFTLEAVVKVNVANPFGMVLNHQNEISNGEHILLRVNGGTPTRLNFAVKDMSGGTFFDAIGGDLRVGETYHLMGVKDRGTIFAYVNGILVATTACFTQAPTLGTDVRIANNFSGVNQQFNGVIDEVTIYDKALSQRQAYSHWRALQLQ